MLSVAICDDETYMRDRLAELVRGFFSGKNMEIRLMQFPCGEELLKYKGDIDILFLDIQMKGMDGMEAAKRLRSAGFKGFLIFVTILGELVFQAFEVQAFDYLVKPVEEGSFGKMMDRLLNVMREAAESLLLVRTGNESRLVAFEDIVYCEVIDRKIYLHLQSEEVVAYYEKLEQLEMKLDSRFFKCHRSYLVNMQYLQSFKNGAAYMSTGETVPVSRLRNRDFADVVLQYMREWRR